MHDDRTLRAGRCRDAAFRQVNRRSWSTSNRFLLFVLALVLCLGPAVSPVLAESPGEITVPESVDDLRTIQTQVEEVLAEAMPAVVGVRIGSSQGSGVIVTEKGYVLTAGHVIGKPKQEVTVIFADGKQVKGLSLGINSEVDAGLIKIEEDGPWPHVEMGHSEQLAEGAWVVALGHPLGYNRDRPPVVRLGRLLRNHGNVLRTDCPLVAGDSGGPLFNLEGNVVGIHSRIAGAATMNFHVPVDHFRNDWDRLVKGEVWKGPLPTRDSQPVEAVVDPLAREAAQWLVQVFKGDEFVSLGTIVGPDGWILTKASELDGVPRCRLPDESEVEAEIVGVSETFDLAMLKVDRRGLPSIQWHEADDPAAGHWVICPVADPEAPDDTVTVGVVGAPRRSIPPERGVLGISLRDTDAGAEVARVLDESAAAEAGIQVGDRVVSVNGEDTARASRVVEAIDGHRPGDSIEVTVERDGETLEFSVTLKRIKTPGMRKRDMQNRSSGGVSERRHGFPAALQHDAVIPPNQCGGPVLNLDGKVVGVNIARGGRTETYLIPRDVLMEQMYDLMSGRLRPPPPEENGQPDAEDDGEAELADVNQPGDAGASGESPEASDKPEDAEEPSGKQEEARQPE